MSPTEQPPRVVEVWGLPVAAVTRPEAVALVARLIERGEPSYFITASTHYAMLTHQQPRLRAVNARAAFIVADGHPVVRGSRLVGAPLPERVAGSDLIYDLSEQAARLGHRVFLLGAAPGVAEEAARRLQARYPGLTIAGVECPPFHPPSPEEHRALIARVRDARPDLLFLAFGQPKGELWLHENVEALGVPVCVQIGASLDFVAGRFRRAPKWVQAIHMEWAFRALQEPLRLAPRYARNSLFLGRMTARDLTRRLLGRPPAGLDPVPAATATPIPPAPRPATPPGAAAEPARRAAQQVGSSSGLEDA